MEKPTDFDDFVQVLGYERNAQQQYFSGMLGKAFSVQELLNGVEEPEVRKQAKAHHIFVSYAEDDHAHKDALLKHLTPLVRLKKATLWDKRGIAAGSDWQNEVFEHLEKADIVLCLISSSFIASEFCFGEELNRAMAAHKAGKKMVIPIKIKEASWEQLEIAGIQPLPRSGWLQGINDDSNWTKIAKGIEAALDRGENKK